ncbi:MAG: hypothetical protein GY898_09845 [Proteobacteria bacterium]|nr:hypothetical protein [Pseudomonadota bacterium]
MAKPIDIDHPAVGATHVFIPGNADSLTAAALLVSKSRYPTWVMLAREHRLPILLERPLSEAAREIWCLGYSGTGHPLLPPALEAHVTHRPLHWLTATSGRLTAAAAEVPGVQFESLPGASLIPMVQGHVSGRWSDDDRAYERLGFILGHYPGARPTDFELTLVNLLHAASVQIRNHENLGAEFVRTLADTPPGQWATLDMVKKYAREGEALIRRGRAVLVDHDPVRGGRHGPALWIVPSGQIRRGTHGKAVAGRAYARQAPAALIEKVERGFTKVWIVLPPPLEELWLPILHVVAEFSSDFAFTGLRGAGAIPAERVEKFASALWPVLSQT